MKAALVILDGWGLGDHERLDAVKAADTPNFDRLADAGAWGTLRTSGRDVGLPRGQMGNSEVGHLTIGAGRVVLQEYTRINDAIESGEFCENDAIAGAFDHVEGTGGRVHFMGLVSDGGVHSDHEHLHALVECAASRDLDATTHAFTDGRDTRPKSGESYLRTLEDVVAEYGTGDVATVSGRYYAMDRDENWERTRKAYDAIVKRNGMHRADSAVDAVRESYERGDTDEFVEPTIVRGGDSLSEGDAVVFFNFRADRARQLVRMLADDAEHASGRSPRETPWAFETDPPDVPVVTMTSYDETFDLPVAFAPHEPHDTLGEVVARAGLTQHRVAESEKYPHVTYFLNGGREVEFEGESREIVPSPDVPTYDQRPEMSAAGVTDAALDSLDSDVLVLNYANADMVGHTGDYDAAVDAVEAVDAELGRLTDALRDAGDDQGESPDERTLTEWRREQGDDQGESPDERAGNAVTREQGAHVLVTADHGNADDMGTPDDPHTAHTYNPVPLIYLAPDGTDGDRVVREDGALRDVAPTLLSLLDVEEPNEMTGDTLLR